MEDGNPSSLPVASTVAEVGRPTVVLVCESLVYYHYAYWDSRSAPSWRPTRSSPPTTPSTASGRLSPSNPLTPSSASPPPPPLPPVVADRHGALFLAHSYRFLVARTQDVIGVAKEKGKGEGLCVEGVSVVDVRIGRVEIVAVSGDQLMLAAAIGLELRFYSATTLLDKILTLDALGLAGLILGFRIDFKLLD